MRVLITGSGGQVGTDTRLWCEQSGDHVTAVGHRELDVTDRDAVLGVITSLRPDVVIHCAAWTAVDACEADPGRAYLANALAVRWVAEACRRASSHLVHLSTDYVFSGTQAEPYTEWDETGPLGVYGASKLAGEREAHDADIGATIIRTSWVVGEHGQNMLKTILRLLADRQTLSFVDDQRGHPTFTSNLATLVRLLAIERRPGLHHVTNQRAVSWFQFAQAVAEAAGRDPASVQPISTAELDPPRPAPRPANSVLDNAVLRMSGLPLLPDFRETLPRVTKAILSRG